MYGDLIEQLLVLLVKTAGYKVTDQQKKIINNGVVGHTDGKINGVVVDYKSASPHSFNKFKNGSIFSDDKKDCWKDANDGQGLRKFKYSNGPKFFTKIVKEPQTQEMSL